MKTAKHRFDARCKVRFSFVKEYLGSKIVVIRFKDGTKKTMSEKRFNEMFVIGE